MRFDRLLDRLTAAVLIVLAICSVAALALVAATWLTIG